MCKTLFIETKLKHIIINILRDRNKTSLSTAALKSQMTLLKQVYILSAGKDNNKT